MAGALAPVQAFAALTVRHGSTAPLRVAPLKPLPSFFRGNAGEEREGGKRFEKAKPVERFEPF